MPSKTLIATAELMTERRRRRRARRDFPIGEGDARRSASTWPGSTQRVKQLAADQSADIAPPARAGGRAASSAVAARLAGPDRVAGRAARRHASRSCDADAVLVATGAAPRTLPTAQPDGERILTWEQVYDLDEVPTELIVVGSGVTGAEFASAYLALGIPVTLVSSRDRVLPGEDADAADGARGGADPPRA